MLATAPATVTGPIRRTMSTDCGGSWTGGVWLDAGIPVTTITVAMPIEMPSADSAARIRRVWMPSSPRRRMSSGASRTGLVSATAMAAVGFGAVVVMTGVPHGCR